MESGGSVGSRRLESLFACGGAVEETEHTPAPRTKSDPTAINMGQGNTHKES